MSPIFDAKRAVPAHSRGRLTIVARAIPGLVALAIAISGGVARADFVDDEARELVGTGTYKRRLAAALTLSKVHDGRSVRSLATALERDKEAKLRQIAALALSKAVTKDTPMADRQVVFAALERAQKGDADAKVRELATSTLDKLASLRPAATAAQTPPVFVYVAPATDGSSKAPGDAADKLTYLVRRVVVRRAPELPTQWPGALPTAKELATRGTKAYAVSATISAVTVTTRGTQSDIACTVLVRVTPWSGTDGTERWVAHKAASATGQGRATTATTARAVAGGIRDCVMAVAEEVTTSKVVPFLQKVCSAP